MANLNLTKLADASIILDGEKVAVKRILKTKEEVIMADGQRLDMNLIRAVGRGFVYDAPKKASTKKPAAESKPASKPAASAKAPAMPANGNAHGRGAPVTADDLPEGKFVTTKDGEKLAVELVLPKKGIVKLAGNVRVELANIVRRGRGFVEIDVTDVDEKPARKPASTESKPASKPAAKKEEHMAIVPSQLRGAKVKVGGRYQTVDKIFGSKGQVKTVEGERLEIANIKQKGTKYIYEVPEAAPAKKPAAKKEEGKASGGIRRREEPVDVSKPASSKKPAAKSEMKPVKIKKVEALHADLVDGLQTDLAEAVKAYIAKHFDLQFVTSSAVFNNEVVTFDLTFALGSYTPKQIAALIADLKADEGEDDTEADDADDSEDFDSDDLTDDADDSEEDDSEEDDDAEEDDSEEDDAEEDDSEEDDAEDDDAEEDDSEEDDDSEEESDDEEDEFEDDAEEDDSEEDGDDIEAKVAAGVKALEKQFGAHSSFEGYAENYLLSDAVEEAFGDDMEIGVTKLKTEKGTYVLVGLHDDGNVILINTKSTKLKKASITDVARMEEI